jgi:glycine/D-amino acid oxidase-like deaminating enzyme
MRKQDLRNGDAVWRAHALPRIFGAPRLRSVRTDVGIVGAGICGAMIAQSLAQAGKRPLIVDRRRAALLGSTAASTGGKSRWQRHLNSVTSDHVDSKPPGYAPLTSLSVR